MAEDVILRNEYEQFTKLYEVRHSELRLEIKEVEQDIRKSIDNLDTKFDGLNNKFEKLSDQMNARSLDVWKLMATGSVSFIVGFITNYITHILK